MVGFRTTTQDYGGLSIQRGQPVPDGTPWEWNKGDAIVSAILREPMDAYEGRGRPVRPGKAYTTLSPVDEGEGYPGNPNVLQLYIPDMRSHWKRCLTNTTVQKVHDLSRNYRKITKV